jgi:hypothetical protein
MLASLMVTRWLQVSTALLSSSDKEKGDGRKSRLGVPHIEIYDAFAGLVSDRPLGATLCTPDGASESTTHNNRRLSILSEAAIIGLLEPTKTVVRYNLKEVIDRCKELINGRQKVRCLSDLHRRLSESFSPHFFD